MFQKPQGLKERKKLRKRGFCKGTEVSNRIAMLIRRNDIL
jgi:hypothetical protein